MHRGRAVAGRRGPQGARVPAPAPAPAPPPSAASPAPAARTVLPASDEKREEEEAAAAALARGQHAAALAQALRRRRRRRRWRRRAPRGARAAPATASPARLRGGGGGGGGDDAVLAPASAASASAVARRTPSRVERHPPRPHLLSPTAPRARGPHEDDDDPDDHEDKDGRGMTHSPHDGGGGGGGGAGSQVDRRAESPAQDKQVVQLLAPPGGKAAEAAATAGAGAGAERLVAKTRVAVGGAGDHGDADEATASGPAPPPDGGWGWVVVFASFMIHIVNDGVTYSFGIFYDALITYFESGRGETAWILSILVGVTLCSGPISSSFVNRYGCRPVTIAGAILGSISLALSVFATNVPTLYLTIGLGTGLGFGLVYLPAIVSVTCYFERRRSLATGIAVCGSGLGTFLLAPVTRWLVDGLGWRHALLCVAAMVLSCAGFGALFRPLPGTAGHASASHHGHAPGERGKVKASASSSSLEELRLKAAPGATDVRRSLRASERDLAEADAGAVLQRPLSVGHLPPARSAHATRPALRAPDHSAARLARSHPALAVSVPPHAGNVESRLAGGTPVMTRKGSGLMYRKDILYSGSLRNIHHKSSSQLPGGAEAEAERLLGDEAPKGSRARANGGLLGASAPCLDASAGDAPPALRPAAAAAHATAAASHAGSRPVSPDLADGEAGRGGSTGCCGRCLPVETTDALREMMDFTLLKDPIFILFTVSNFLTSIGYNVPYLYVAVQAKERHLSEDQAGWLLAAIGFANTVGRIVLGYISDKPWVDRLLVYNLCLTICGVATAFSALCESYASFMMYSLVFGCSIGAYVGLTSVVLVDLLGLERLTNAFGLLLLFQGFASLIGPPIAGWLYDATGSYNPGFIVAGVTMALSGVMLFVIPPVQRRLAAKRCRQEALELQPTTTTTLTTTTAANGDAPGVHC